MYFNLEIPEDLEDYVRQFQGQIKSSRHTGFYALPKCIVAIIREHKELVPEVAELKKEITRLKRLLPGEQNPEEI